MLIETHAHLDFPEYDDDFDDVIKRANDSGVGIIINVSASIESNLRSVALSRKYDCIYSSCGVHPHDSKLVTSDTVNEIKSLILSSDKVVAIGEVGLDFYKNISPRDSQEKIFVKFVNLSKELDLPLIIHCRNESANKKDASAQALKIMKQYLGAPLRGVMHCFSGDKTLLREYLDAGLYVSFTCNVTFERAEGLREVLKYVPVERLLLETDCPFLAPQAKRGERNEPAYLQYLVNTVSESLNISKQEVADITTQNAKRLFNIS
ncbi:MAG: TatD family hydrolase [Candidatus Omnitrophota bacterium]